MSRANARDGAAWLVADRARGDYVCYQYNGPAEDHLLAQDRATTAQAAVAWGRERTTRVRIRTAGGHTYWAGADAKPAGIPSSWTDREVVAAT
jgi:hypothetical protein